VAELSLNGFCEKSKLNRDEQIQRSDILYSETKRRLGHIYQGNSTIPVGKPPSNNTGGREYIAENGK